MVSRTPDCVEPQFFLYILNFYTVLLTMPKALTVWITINCGKFFKRWEYETT